MDTQVITKVSSSVYCRFPEFNGCRPTVRKQKKPQAKSTSTTVTYLLTYKTKALVTTSSGSKSLPRSVRVVATENGKILKMTTSR
ncbi:MAG: hypothetical protein KAT29_09395 [Anaerolineales bacterium]|nr:hypothetical protein [Anaerolineales bacterium]